MRRKKRDIMANGECSCHLRAMRVLVITVAGRPVLIASFWVRLALAEYLMSCHGASDFSLKSPIRAGHDSSRLKCDMTFFFPI